MGGWSYDNRWVVLLICLGILALFIYFSMSTRFDMSLEAFFHQDDPTYGTYLEFRDDFSSDEISYLLYRAPHHPHGPWNIEVMRQIDKLSRSLEEKVPFVRKVTSLTNVEFMEGVPGGIKVYDLLESFPDNQKELLQIRDNVLAKPSYVGGLASEDGGYAAIIIEMEKSCIDPPDEIKLDPKGGSGLNNLYPQVSMDAIESILGDPQYRDIDFFHAGDVPFNAIYNRIAEKESMVFMGVTFLIIGILLALIFRTPVDVAGPFAVVILALAISVGFIGLMGWNMDFMFALLPTLLIAIGVADSVHIITTYKANLPEVRDRREAIRRTMYLVGTPCLLTSLTTAAGFSAMSISRIKCLAHFALYSAVGVIAAFLLSVTLLIVFLSFGKRVPEIKKPSALSTTQGFFNKIDRAFGRMLDGIAHFDVRFRKPILCLFFLGFVLSGIGITKLTVDSNFLKELKEKVPLRRVTEFVDDVMGGTSSVVYLFDTGTPDGIKDIEVLREIERIQREADKHTDIVRKTYSIVDILKDINQSFHDGDPAYFVLPESRELVAQYLLLYSMSGGSEAEDYVSGDYSRARLELRCKMIEMSRLGQMLDEIEAFRKARPEVTSSVQVTGIGVLWLVFMEYITQSQIQGILLAFTVVAAMMCFVLKSIRIGLISMIPNLSPVVLILGVMGWIGLPLDYVRLLVATVAIGIAVDDTIHLVTRYRYEFLLRRNYTEALQATMQDVGRALFTTSFMLISGFLVNLLSVTNSISTLGILLAGTILAALMADFFLMPAIIMTFQLFGPEENPV
jgi:predicted RND superfamily exporter protein